MVGYVFVGGEAVGVGLQTFLSVSSIMVKCDFVTCKDKQQFPMKKSEK